MSKISRLHLLFVISVVLAAQSSQPSVDNLVTRGTANGAALTKMFAGDFLHLDFDREDMKFLALFQRYMEAYGRRCSLPEGQRVPIMTSQCKLPVEHVVRNGRGLIISRTPGCDLWESVATGLYAKPELYGAKKLLDQQRAGDLGRVASQTMELGKTTASLGEAQSFAADMDRLVEINGCKSPSLNRFEDNLRLFALNRPPIKLAGEPAATATAQAVTGLPFRDQNYTKLMEDLVEDDATKWGAFARLVVGSVRNPSVLARDGTGHPTKIVAEYTWQGWSRTQGSVTLTVTDGMMTCLTYSETPSVCHTPNRKIAAAYADGAYK